MEPNILQEQIAYYRARAQEYDESIFQTGRFAAPEAAEALPDGLAAAMQVLQTLGPFERVLELACGTGIWTSALVTLGQAVTAIDAAPEMIEVNKAKVASSRIQYIVADLFAWEPSEQYDLVFFAFWLSHVPPAALDAFLGTVQKAVRPGGQLVIIDQHAPTQGDLLAAKEGIFHTRTLLDGRSFIIVKVFHQLALLQEALTRLGFAVAIQTLDDTFFFLSATLPS
jgi:2-polyprenyl-3-methyl-5-hydroxy-6-metoxy-1,4-benzoquinol methylase